MFECLPTVDSCCFCCSLRVGAILIAIAGVLGVSSAAGNLIFVPLCGNNTGVTPDVVKYISYINLESIGLLEILCIIYLIAACLEKCSTIATLFLIAITQFLIIQLATIIALIVLMIIDKNCDKTQIVSLLITTGLVIYPMWLYFMIVVRSYKENME